jgi:Ca2+-binding RTX toxin-like protein
MKSASAGRSILFIDSSVEDYSSLIESLPGDYEVVMLESDRDGVFQIANYLSSYSDLAAVHIISHGSAGQLSLGNTTLNSTNLDAYQRALAAIGSALSEQGDILLYGCNVAAGEVGQSFIDNLAELTGADVAASDDLTGVDGDWKLEVADGQIESQGLCFKEYAQNLAECEFRVNTYTDSDQMWSSGTVLTGGGFVVTWQSNDQDGSREGIYGQSYNSDGGKVGSEFKINTSTSDVQGHPAVCSLGDGGFFVTWDSDDIYGQRYDSGGNKVGSEITINTFSFSESAPAIAGLHDGGFVVTWDSTGQDDDITGIYGQRYNSSGSKVDSEFHINTYTTSIQYSSSVTTLDDGSFVVVWASQKDQYDSVLDVHGQRFSSSANKIGNEFQVNTFTRGIQEDPSIAALVGGGFIVTWTSLAQDGNGTGIYGQRYSSVGSKVGSEFRVNTYWSFDQDLSSVSGLKDGGFIVTWNSLNQDGSKSGIYGQRYNSSGSKVGGEFRINSTVNDNQFQPTILSLNDGGFVVTWNSLGQDGSGYGVYGKRFKADGTPVAPVEVVLSDAEFLTNSYADSDQTRPSVAGLNNGAFVTVWESQSQDGSGLGIYGQRFDAAGNRLGDEFLVNTGVTNNQSDPFVTHLSDGGFLVTWESENQDGSSYGIYGQRYNADGSKNSSEFMVNSFTTGAQGMPSAAAFADGKFIVTWQSENQDGDSYGVYGQLYNSGGSKVGSEFKVNSYTSDNQMWTSVTEISTGGFVVTWTSSWQDSDSFGNYGQFYDANGVSKGSNFLINTTTANEQALPSVAALKDGKFVVTWESAQDSDGSYGIYGQIFGVDANVVSKVGSQFQANSTTADSQQVPSVVGLADGSFVVTWMSFGENSGNWDICGQRFNSTGTKIGDEMHISTYANGNQISPSVAALSTGGFVVSWSSPDDNGQGYEIYSKIFNADGTVVKTAGANGGSANDDIITGTIGNDTLFGRGGNDTLYGLAGNDTLDGGTGEDKLYGGPGDDVYIRDNVKDTITEKAGEGNDTVKTNLSYTIAALPYLENIWLTGTDNIDATGNSGANILTGNDGNNIFDGGGGSDTVSYLTSTNASGVTVSLSVTTAQNTGAGNDTIKSTIENLIGSEYNDFLIGNSVANVLNGMGGADTMKGDGGNDLYYVDNDDDVVDETKKNFFGDVVDAGGIDKVESSVEYYLPDYVEILTLKGSENIDGYGNELDNTLYGNLGNNKITGYGGKDTLYGGAGDDQLAGGDYVSANIMYGGSGNDTYLVHSSKDLVYETNPGTTTDSGGVMDGVRSDIPTYTLTSYVENLELTGTDNISGTGNISNNLIIGNQGKNTLKGGSGDDTLLGVAFGDGTIDDQDGNDMLYGEIGNDLLYGRMGNDTLDGGTGNDTMFGGSGDDTYYIDSNTDQAYETTTATSGIDSGGTNDLVSSSVSYTLKEFFENLTLTGGTKAINGTGNSLNNVLTGNAGINTLNGGSGDDIMIGGSGNDYYYVDSGNDETVEKASGGNDTVFVYSSLNYYQLRDNVEDLILESGTVNQNGAGNSSANYLYGNDGNNILEGGGNGDTIYGKGGNDTLKGGSGNDIMYGGADNDSYDVDSMSDKVYETTTATSKIDTGGVDSVNLYLTSASTYTLSDYVENLIIYGTDAVNVTGNSQNNSIQGNENKNILKGGIGNDTLEGNGGNDTLDGGANNDIMKGGSGNDTYYVDSTNDIAYETTTEANNIDAGGDDDYVISSASFTLRNYIERLTLTGKAISGIGNNSNNTLLGNAEDNVLDGGLGSDFMIGGRGNDTYYVDDDHDRIIENYSQGTDIVISTIDYTLGDEIGLTESDHIEILALAGDALKGTGNSLNNTIQGNDKNNTLSGEEGNDILLGLAGDDTMIGGWGDDTYYVDSDGDWIEEGIMGTDTVISTIDFDLSSSKEIDHPLYIEREKKQDIEKLQLIGEDDIDGSGNSKNNTITGNNHDNTLSGFAGYDTLYGQDGDDILNGGDGNDILYGGIGNDSLYGDNDNDTLYGDSGNDTLSGSFGNDTLYGGTGNDFLYGGSGSDIMYGGANNDTYFVDSTGDKVYETISTDGVDKVETFQISYTLGNNLENLTLNGNNAINGIGNILNNIITGSDCNNKLDGAAGNDTLIGGLGDDTYYVNAVGDIIAENLNEGTDTVNSTATFFTLADNVENLTLSGTAVISGTGNSLGNILLGNAAANTLNGMGGADTMKGGGGNDTYYVDHDDDVVDESWSTTILGIEVKHDYGGIDKVVSSIDGYQLPDYVENLTLSGTGAINGTGNKLANTLIGNSAINILNGGTGNDILTGGGGADSFLFDTALNATTNKDNITDFLSANDTIVLDNSIFTKLITEGVLSANNFRSSTTGTAADDNDYILYNTTTGGLFYDADGNKSGVAIQFATLTSKPQDVAYTNFLVG